MPKNSVIPVFSGAGVNGAAHIGAINLLEKLLGSLTTIQHTAGSSAGSIAALLLAFNLSAEEIKKAYFKIDFSKVPDGHNVLNEGIEIIKQDSIYEGKALRETIKNLFIGTHGNTDITFRDLKKWGYKDLKVMTTVVGVKSDGTPTTAPKEFSADATPDTSIFLAVLASSSIPGYYPPVRLKEISPGNFVEDEKEGYQFIDGGFCENLPEELFDKRKYIVGEEKIDGDGDFPVYNENVLGFMVTTPQEIRQADALHPIAPHDVKTYFTALVEGAALGSQDRAYMKSENPERTIALSNLNNSSTNYNITKATQEKIIAAAMDVRVENDLRLFLGLPVLKVAKAADYGTKRVTFSNTLFTPISEPMLMPIKEESSKEDDCSRCVIS